MAILAGTAICMLLVFGLVCQAMVREFRQQDELFARLRASNLVFQETLELAAVLSRAESTQRGYILTGDGMLLSRYALIATDLVARLERLRRNLAAPEHPPAARDALARLVPLIGRKIAEMNDTIDIRRRQGLVAGAEAALLGFTRLPGIDGQTAALSASENAARLALRQRYQEQAAHTWFTVVAAVVMGSLCTILATVAAGFYLKRRGEIELQLTRTAGLLQDAIGNVAQGLALLTPGHGLAAWNERFGILIGTPQDQLVSGASLREVAPILRRYEEAGGHRTVAPISAIEQLGPSQEASFELKIRGGRTIELAVRRTDRGNLVFALSDVTARVAREQHLADAATRLEAIFENAIDGMIIIEEDGTIDSANPAAAAIFGYGPDELPGKDISLLLPMLRTAEGGVAPDGGGGIEHLLGAEREVEGGREGGASVPLSLTLGEMRLAGGRLFIAIMRDITERRRLDRMKNEFVSIVSHELRTPLTSINGSLGLLASGIDGALPARSVRLVQIARQNCERLIRLINDILDMEKLQAGRMEFQRSAQELGPVIEACVLHNRPYAQKFGVTIDLEPSLPAAHVLLDADRLQQALTNLIGNAVKFSPPDGIVEVRMTLAGTRVRVTVTDRGRGIPDEFKSKIFGRFMQANSGDDRDQGGTGLGLNIAKLIVDGLGGTIGFTSEAGQGTSFWVDLPLLPAAWDGQMARALVPNRSARAEGDGTAVSRAAGP